MSETNISDSTDKHVSFSVPPEMQTLHAQTLFLISQAKAPNTRRTNQSKLKPWFEFMESARISLPADGWALARYATTLVVSGRIKSADSLANYVSAVRGYHRDLGLPCPTPSEFGPLDQVIKGLRKIALRPVKRSLPITPEILVNFLTTLFPPPFCPVQSQTLAIYKILSLFYYLTVLRASSFMVNSYNAVDTVRLVCWGNVENDSFDGIPGIRITLHLTKTIQCAERIQEVPLAQNNACPLLCPVRAIACLREITGEHNITADTPLFQVRDYQGNLKPVLRHHYDSWYKFRLGEMGLDASLFTLHGWRHGGIQQVLMSEENLALCKITSDHSSDVILEYSYVPANRRLEISQKVNNNLSQFVNQGLLQQAALPVRRRA